MMAVGFAKRPGDGDPGAPYERDGRRFVHVRLVPMVTEHVNVAVVNPLDFVTEDDFQPRLILLLNTDRHRKVKALRRHERLEGDLRRGVLDLDELVGEGFWRVGRRRGGVRDGGQYFVPTAANLRA